MGDGYIFCCEARNKTGHASAISVGRDRHTSHTLESQPHWTAPVQALTCSEEPQERPTSFSTSMSDSRIRMAGCAHAVGHMEPLEAQRAKDKQEQTIIFRRIFRRIQTTAVLRPSDTIRVSLLTGALSLLIALRSSNVWVRLQSTLRAFIHSTHLEYATH
jgi:hypothetical protein